MGGQERDDTGKRKRKLLIILLLLLLLFAAGFFLVLFRHNLFQTPDSGNKLSAGRGEGGYSPEISSGTAVFTDAGGTERADQAAQPPKPEPASQGVTAGLRQEAPVQDGPGPLSALLPAPGNMLPPNGHRIGIEELKKERDIQFSWSAVPGANAYIFTLYQETANGRRLIIQNAPDSRTGWTLANIGILDRGTFVWRVEPVNVDRDGAVKQRGSTGENTFTLDIPDVGPVYVEETGIFYEDY